MSRCPTCEKEAREARAAARANGELEGGTVDRNGRVVHFSEAERQRRSELAKRLHAEGRFGGAVIGANGGRSIRRHRITDAVLDHFRQPDTQQLVIKAYERALKDKKDKRLGLSAAEAITRMDEKVAERERADRGGAQDPYAMTKEELEEFVAQGLEGMIARGELPVDVEIGDEDVKEVA